MAARLSATERARVEALRSEGSAARTSLLGSVGIRRRCGASCAADATLTGAYRAEQAQAAAQARARRPRTPKLEADRGLASRVRRRLKRGWSPHAVSADLARCSQRVRAQTICRAAYSGCGLGPKAHKLLPRRRRRRRPRGRAAANGSPLGSSRPLRERPEAAADRTEPGHREGDLIVGKANRTAAATLVERTSRHTPVAPLAAQRHTPRPQPAAARGHRGQPQLDAPPTPPPATSRRHLHPTHSQPPVELAAVQRDYREVCFGHQGLRHVTRRRTA